LFAITNVKHDSHVSDAKMWAGIGYLYSRAPTAPTLPGLALSVVGVYHSTMWGMCADMAWGGPIGGAVGGGIRL